MIEVGEYVRTNNIHKKINRIISVFKSKFLCKLGLHNFQLFTEKKIKPVVYQDFVGRTSIIKHIQEDYTISKCKYCSKIKEKVN